MAVTMTGTYTGDLHCDALHGPSGATLQTDAPVDNQGKGETFSPTDLATTAMATCMLTIMGIQARTRGISIDGTTFTATKEMTTQPPRRIARIAVEFVFPTGIAEADRKVLERAAHACPVHRSFHPDVVIDATFVWG